MSRTILKWTLLAIAGAILGPIAYHLIGATPAPDGSRAVTALLSASPVRSTLLTALCLVMAGAIGVLTARLVSVRSGMFASGLVLIWAAASGGHLEAIIRRTHSGSSLVALAAEGALLGAAGILIAWLITRRSSGASADGAAAPLGPALGIVVGAIAGWAVARSGMTGQTIAAAAAAGLFGTLVGTVVDQRSALWTYASIAVVLGLVGPLIAKFTLGDRLVEAVYAGTVSALAWPAPMDWLAGVLIGVPMGDAWAASMLERKAGSPESATPKAA